MISRPLATALALIFGTGLASAQSGPQLLTVFPPGGKAGETVEVTLAGVGFDGEEQLLFSQKGFKAESAGAGTKLDPKAKQPGMKGQPAASVKFKVTVPKDAPAGVHDLRVVSKAGLSNPRAFVVSNYIEANETEPNNDVGQAQKIALNSTVNGIITAPTDVDYVIFPAKAGQSIVVYCLTTSIDSRLSADIMVSTLDGKPLAVGRGYRGGDAVLDFKAPADGEYLVRTAQFAYTTGGTDHFYRLTVSTNPWIDAVFPPTSSLPKGQTQWKSTGRNLTGNTTPTGTPATGDQTDKFLTQRVIPPSAGMIDGVDWFRNPEGNPLLVSRGPVVLDNEDNDTATKAQAVTIPCDVAGRVEKKNDRDWYSFEAKKGDVWTLELFAERIGSQFDGYLLLTDDKGKVISEVDDGPDTLSPNQFYTKSDDPARYRFAVPADGTYRVLVASREASIQFGMRDQYVLRIAKENPDFRIAIMPDTPHLPDASTLPKGGSLLLSVFVFRFDGFNDAIELTAANLPAGVTCPPQAIGAGQTRGSLVLTCADTAKDWEGFVTITATAGNLKRTARPFTVTWAIPGTQLNQPPPNVPMLTRMDRGEGLALAVRGEAPFTLTIAEKEVKTKAGGKIELNLKATRGKDFKDGIQVISAVPNFGPRQQGNNPVPPIATIAADKSEAKVSVDVQPNTPPGTYTLVLAGRKATPPPKGGNAPGRLTPNFPATPVTIIVEGNPKKK